MKDIDSYAIEVIGIPGMVLMERASLKVLDHLETDTYTSYVLVAGVGNNGGDGVALARHLKLIGKEVLLLVIGEKENGSEGFKKNLEIYQKLNGQERQVIYIKEKADLGMLEESLEKGQVLVDALFGIGLSRDVEGIYRDTIVAINNFKGPIVSVDIPSGLNGDTGEAMGAVVKADKTVTFHRMKQGLENSEYGGQIYVEDIGIPDKESL